MLLLSQTMFTVGFFFSTILQQHELGIEMPLPIHFLVKANFLSLELSRQEAQSCLITTGSEGTKILSQIFAQFWWPHFIYKYWLKSFSRKGSPNSFMFLFCYPLDWVARNTLLHFPVSMETERKSIVFPLPTNLCLHLSTSSGKNLLETQQS